jgi:hypothetical protein
MNVTDWRVFATGEYLRILEQMGARIDQGWLSILTHKKKAPANVRRLLLYLNR